MLDDLIDGAIRYPRRSLAVILVFLACIAAVLWWNLVWQNPQAVFSDMLANNLTATSVTKRAAAHNNGQNVSQYACLQTGSVNRVEWVVTAQQSGSSVTTESIATPTTGYVRYTHIASKSKNVSGKSPDFQDVLNVWAKGDNKADANLNQLFSQTVFDIGYAPLPPIAHLTPNERQDVLSYMHDQNIFSISNTNPKTQKLDGKNVYTYQVSVHLVPYIQMMQSFAHDLGLKDLDSLSADQYAASPPVALTMSVDKASHQLVNVTYPAIGFTQSYSDWGLQTPIAIPHANLSTTQLEARIQSIR